MPESVNLPDTAATEACGARLAKALSPHVREPFVVHLSGALGSGKTTLVRGVLRAFGVAGVIRSPTYTLVETYPARDRVLVHLDLYRLAGPDELEDLGVRELLTPGHVLFIEWPERGGVALPAPDLAVRLAFTSPGRRLRAQAATRAAEPVVQEWFR